MKTILVITHAGGSPHHGPNMRWYYLGQALKPLGVQVEIVSSSFFHKYLTLPDVQEAFKTEIIDGLSYHWIRTNSYKTRGLVQVKNQAEYVAGCYSSVRHLVNRKPDIVIASSPHPFVNFPAARIADKAGAKFIFEVRDLWPAILLELGSFSPWHPYMAALKYAEQHGVKWAQRIISVKPGDWRYFQSVYGFPKDKFCYIPNGFLPQTEGQHVHPVIEKLRCKYQFIVGYAGALSSYYGLDNLVELAGFFKNRNDVGFVVVGKGELQSTLARKASEAGLDNFHLVGAIPKSSVQTALKTFDACYVGLADLDIHKYGISCNKIYEYMHAGKPVIGSYSTDHDPVAEAECGIVARPGNHHPLVQGLEEMIANPSLCDEYGKHAKNYFSRFHDFSVVAKEVVRQLFPGNR